MDEPLNIDFISEITWANYEIAKETERIKELENRGRTDNIRTKKNNKRVRSNH
jgi:hypothetical protein